MTKRTSRKRTVSAESGKEGEREQNSKKTEYSWKSTHKKGSKSGSI